MVNIEGKSETVETKEHHGNLLDFASKLEQKSHKVSKNNNNLPLNNNRIATQKTSIYRPDIIVYDENDDITHILEIETGDGGKSMVGAIFLADSCISSHIRNEIQDSTIKPHLIFLILGSKDTAIKRINAIESYLKSVMYINLHIYTKIEAYKELFNTTEKGL
ncbi:MAG: hypothetical protein O8C61_07245 [Candidatus Methanoperedens sp.]|nr:hypothetical protein [Candidatus Methanoperedens sp.]